jgi:LemA protein
VTLSLIITGIILCYLYSLYAKVIKNKNMVLEALSGVDVQLKRRYDLIPNLVEIAKTYMAHEKYIFEKITELRSSAMGAKLGSKEKFNTEIEISKSVQNLLLTAENYPELKANESMLKLMDECTETEDNIAAARRFYNTALTQLKNTIEIFPGCLFANFADKTRFYNYFKASNEERNNIKI